MPSVSAAEEAAPTQPDESRTGKPAVPTLALGWEYDLSGKVEEFLLPDPLPDESVTSQHPFYARLRVPWTLVEPSAGTYDWSEVDRIVDPYLAAQHVVILALYGGNPAYDPDSAVPTATRAEVLKGWLDLLRAAALHFKGRVAFYEIGRSPNLEPDWSGAGVADYAYVLKNSSVVVRSADPAARIAEGMLEVPASGAEEALTWQADLYRQDVAPYVDVLPVKTGSAPLARTLSSLYDLLLDQDPSSQLWSVEAVPEGETDRARAADLLRRFVVAQGEGASLVTFDLEADVEGRPEFPGLLLDIHKLFLPTYDRRPGGGVRFVAAPGGAPPPQDVREYRFFDAKSYQGLVVFYVASRPEEPRATLILDTAAVRGAAIYDLVGGKAQAASGVVPDFKTNTTAVPITLRARPQIVLYARVPIQGFEAEKEKVDVSSTGLITVEEILANHQRFMADQNFRLKHYRAAGRVEYHYKISGSNTVDVAYDEGFFWDRETGPEWQQTALYLNGVRWKGRRFPDIPLIQPEKVLTLPLDINLNKDYDYEYLGKDTADGYDCYVVGFKPKDRAKTLYEGKVWIETRTFARVRTSLVEHGMQPPVTSNDERDRYEPIAGPDGTTYWLLTHVEGQQIFTTAGRNLVVLREISLSGFQINDPGFEDARSAAYASDEPMLRDTDRGLRYLDHGPGRTPTVEEHATRSSLFAIGGVFAEPGLDYPLPLAGVNYFNYNLGGRQAQINAFLAGAVNTVTFTDPRLFGHVDGTVEALLVGLRFTDRYYVAGEKREESNVDTRPQHLATWLGLPLGSFFRLRGGYTLNYEQYSNDSLTSTFTTPSDTLVHGPDVQGEFNRGGWTVTATGSQRRRATWDPWGDRSAPGPDTLREFPSSPCDSPGSCLAEFDPGRDHYRTWEFSVGKQVFLPAFQKVRFEATWLQGSNLDRFSEFDLGFFNNRVRGFSGAGVRFDRGGIARLQYAFNIHDVIRFDASLDHAHVREGFTSDRYSDFTGFGFGGTVLGPWRTLLTFDLGVALKSDYAGLAGSTEGEVVLFKFF